MTGLSRILFCYCIFFTLTASLFLSGTALAKNKVQTISIAYLGQAQEPPPPSANPEAFVKNKGFPGAELAIDDNNSTGKFTGQQFDLKILTLPANGDAVSALKKLIEDKYQFIVVDLPADEIIRVADLPEAKDLLLLDVFSKDDALRNALCRRNVLHLLPSRAMRADAMAQYLRKKRWDKVFLLQGKHDGDKLFADAVKHAAARFGLEIVSEKQWQDNSDVRRTVQTEIPVATQTDDDYDVLIVADEHDEFGDYLEFRTWFPRPVAGTQGLTATAWHWTHEQWGATQLQNRFIDKYARSMGEIDYAAYLAVRAIGEAATRARSTEPGKVREYLLSPAFALQGYKGAALSFRPWNGQLRQPVLLSTPRSTVAVAPIEGFLHPVTELDTLGYDQSQSTCNFAK